MKNLEGLNNVEIPESSIEGFNHKIGYYDEPKDDFDDCARTSTTDEKEDPYMNFEDCARTEEEPEEIEDDYSDCIRR